MSNLFSRAKLPWSLHEGNDYCSICDATGQWAIEDITVSNHDDDEAKAILEEVVKRVNAHDSLVEALKEGSTMLASVGGPQGPEWDMERRRVVLDKMLAALAQLGGQK